MTQPVFFGLLERACALLGILLLLPVFAVIALLILATDGRPVLFLQERIGLNGRPFRIRKFRTMKNGYRGTAITAAGDARVIRVGYWLRQFKLDELPQLFNVLWGEMSLIGPRPEVRGFVEFDNPLWREVLGVKPGITDLASLMFRNEEEALAASDDPEAYYSQTVLPQKLRLNIRYMRSRSLWRDLRLLLLTVEYSLLPGRFDRDHIEQTLALE